MRESAVASNFIRSKAEAPHRKTPIFTTATCDALFSTFVICHFCWRTVQLSLYLSLLSRSLASLLFLRTIRRRRRRRQQQRQRCVCVWVYVCVSCQFCALPSILVHKSIRSWQCVSARVCTNLIWLCDRFEIHSHHMPATSSRTSTFAFVCVATFHCMRVEERSVSKWKAHMDWVDIDVCARILHGESEWPRRVWARLFALLVYTFECIRCFYAPLSNDNDDYLKAHGHLTDQSMDGWVDVHAVWLTHSPHTDENLTKSRTCSADVVHLTSICIIKQLKQMQAIARSGSLKPCHQFVCRIWWNSRSNAIFCGCNLFIVRFFALFFFLFH